MQLEVSKGSFAEAIDWVRKAQTKKDNRVQLNISPRGAVTLFMANQSVAASAPVAVEQFAFEDDDPEKTVAKGVTYIMPMDMVATLDGGMNGAATVSITPMTVGDGPAQQEQVSFAGDDGTHIRIPLLLTKHRATQMPEVTELFTVGVEEFFPALRQLNAISDKERADASMPYSTIWMSVPEGTCQLVATDRYAFGVVKLPVTMSAETEALEGIEQETIMLPQSHLSMLTRPPKGVAQVQVGYNQHSRKVGFAFEDGKSIVISTPNMKPLNLTPIWKRMEAEHPEKVMFPRTDARSALNVLRALEADDSKVELLLDAEETTLALTDVKHQGRLRIPVDAEHTTLRAESQSEMMLYREPLGKVLSSCPSPNIVFEFGAPEPEQAAKEVIAYPVTEKGERIDHGITYLLAVHAKR